MNCDIEKQISWFVSTELNLLTICLLEDTKTNPIFINYQAPTLNIKEDEILAIQLIRIYS